MSLKSWKQEYYPTPAHSTRKEEAVEHALRKWTGLLEENLQRHNVSSNGSPPLVEEKAGLHLKIDADTCALCEHYQDVSASCCGCPMVLSDAVYRSCDMLYKRWRVSLNPKPMIKALKQTLAWEKKQKENGHDG